jgi:excisionase family DNA binding protein
MKNNNEKMTVSVEEMAVMLGISRSVAYKLTHEQGFPAIRVSERRLIIPKASLSRWLEERATQ